MMLSVIMATHPLQGNVPSKVPKMIRLIIIIHHAPQLNAAEYVHSTIFFIFVVDFFDITVHFQLFAILRNQDTVVSNVNKG